MTREWSLGGETRRRGGETVIMMEKLINKKMMKICCMKLSYIYIYNILCFKEKYRKMLTVDSR